MCKDKLIIKRYILRQKFNSPAFILLLFCNILSVSSTLNNTHKFLAYVMMYCEIRIKHIVKLAVSCAPFWTAPAIPITIQPIQTPHKIYPYFIFIPIRQIQCSTQSKYGCTKLVCNAWICIENRPWQPKPTLRILGPGSSKFHISLHYILITLIITAN